MKPPNEPPEDITAFDEYRDDEYFTHSVNAYYDLNESLPGPWVDIEIGSWGRRSGTREELMRDDPRIVEIIEPPHLSRRMAVHRRSVPDG